VSRKPPPAPKVLDAAQCREWRTLWSTTAATSWLPEDEPLVLRLIQLRRRAESEGARWQIEHVRGLEDRLLLSGPRGRQRGGISSPEPPEPEPSKANGRARLSSRERERLLRG
jgi:hypothetical protein